MEQVAATVGASNIVWDTIEFHDIAGLVAGAYQGRGPRQQVPGQHPRVRRAAARRPHAHTTRTSSTRRARVDPAADIETIETELLLADLDTAERRHARSSATPAPGDRAAVAEEAWLRQVIEALQSGKPARTVPVPHDAPDAAAQPLAADRQAGAVRRQRRRGRRRGAVAPSPTTPPPPAPPRSRSPPASRPSCPSSTTTRRR